MRVSVIGGGDADSDDLAAARDVGRLLADRGHVIVCGGRGGVMEAVCRGAVERDGDTIGILPGEDRREANPYVGTVVATGLGHGRNALVVLNGDAVIAIGGDGGTLSEIGYASVYDRPIAGLSTHDVAGVESVATPAEAVEWVERATGVDSDGDDDGWDWGGSGDE
ncbi:MAG: TIGR00725 family protein [Haloferacaceae archaeon]